MRKDGKAMSKEIGEINGLIDRGCEFEGKLLFEGVVQINGGFKGEISSDGRLIVGKDAIVNAKIAVGELIVEGRVEGSVDARGKVEIRSGAIVIADLITSTLIVEDGGVLHGGCQMHGAKPHLQEVNVAKPAALFVERDEAKRMTM